MIASSENASSLDATIDCFTRQRKWVLTLFIGYYLRFIEVTYLIIIVHLNRSRCSFNIVEGPGL